MRSRLNPHRLTSFSSFSSRHTGTVWTFAREFPSMREIQKPHKVNWGPKCDRMHRSSLDNDSSSSESRGTGTKQRGVDVVASTKNTKNEKERKNNTSCSISYVPADVPDEYVRPPRADRRGPKYRLYRQYRQLYSSTVPKPHKR